MAFVTVPILSPYVTKCRTKLVAESTSKSTWFLFLTAIYDDDDDDDYYSLLSECPVTCDLGLTMCLPV